MTYRGLPGLTEYIGKSRVVGNKMREKLGYHFLLNQLPLMLKKNFITTMIILIIVAEHRKKALKAVGKNKYACYNS